MSEKQKEKLLLEDPIIDPLRESSLTIVVTSGALIIPSRISKDMKLDLPRFKLSKQIGKIIEKKKEDKKKSKKIDEN